MTLKLALAVAVLAILPAVASAQCSHGDKRMSTSVCAEGQLWDATSQSCVDTSA